MSKLSWLFVCISICISGCAANSSNEVEQLKKEADLAKKELELTKKELEMSKASPTPPPISSQLVTPTPTSIEKTDLVEKVSIRLISSNPDNKCIPSSGQKIFLASKNEIRYAAYLDAKGRATFNTFKGIKCGQTIQIEAVDEDVNSVEIREKLSCAKAVNLGTFDLTTGNKVTEKFANNCLK